MRKIKRIPTILGLLILLMGVAGGVIFVKNGTTWFLKASPGIVPKQVKITNITENSFSVSWITDGQTSSFVKYGLDKSLSFTASDDRDQLSGKTGNFFTHHITLKNLKPLTVYYFDLRSGGSRFDNNGQLYQITTAPTIQISLPANDVAYGNVVSQESNPAEGVIIYLSLADAAPLSALTKSSGSWVIPLNLARSASLAAYAAYDREASIEEIFIQGGSLGTATAVATTKYDSPLPLIKLGGSYDFRTPVVVSPTVAPQVTSPPSAGFSFSEVATPSAATGSASLNIINPGEQEQISTTSPEILGTGPAGETLTIEVHSLENLTGQVTVKSDGTWNWTPPSNLSPGEHTINASLADGTRVSRSFTVLAAGSEVPAFTATPSAIASASPTPTVKPTPTATVSAGRTSIPSTEGGIPSSGYLTPTFLVSIMGIVLMGLGLVGNILFKRI